MDDAAPGIGSHSLSGEGSSAAELFLVCQSVPEQEREAWLASHCVSEEALTEVRRLLEDFARSSFLERGAAYDAFGAYDYTDRLGHFRILKVIGRGGMGVVYEAIDERLNRRSALKVLPQAHAEDLERRQRLLWEARAASSLNHPNIVTIYEIGFERNLDYIAMECVQGKSLAEILAEGPLPSAMALDVALQIATALEAAHACGIVHRDLKPGNVMVTPEGLIKLLDFGLAKRVVDGDRYSIAQTVAPYTIEGEFAGTATYVSPEMAQGKPTDVRSDVFTFGSVLYEMLTGEKAFKGDTTVSLLAGIIYAEPEPASQKIRTVDSRFDKIIAGCLRKDPAARYASMAEVRRSLQQIRDGPSGRMNWRRIAWAAAMLLVVMATAFGIAILKRLGSQLPNGGPETTAANLSKVTSDTGLNGYPALSPDGKLIAYSSDRGSGNLDLWVQQAGGSDPIRVTTNSADDYQPSFSPDGTRIAFRSERSGGGVYTVPALGGSERLLAPGCRDPRFSPDGQSVACWMGRIGGALPTGTAHIVIVPAAGGQPRPFRPDFAASAFPVWTADGRRLVFLGHRLGEGRAKATIDWWVASLDGTDAIATGAMQRFRAAGLSPSPGAYWIMPESLRRSGNAVLFTATHGDATNIWQLPLDSEGRADGGPTQVTIGASIDSSPRVSETANQSAMVFASLSVDIGIWKLPLKPDGTAGGEVQLLASGLPGIGSPSLSYDGRTLVFSSSRSSDSRVMALDARKAGMRVLASAQTPRPLLPILSGDGSTLIYSIAPATNRMRIHDGIPEQICSPCTPTYVNADGTEVLLEASGGDANETRLQLWTSGEVRPLIRESDPRKRDQFSGRLSPDGKWVVFSSATRSSPAHQIVIVPKAPERVIGPEERIEISEGDANNGQPSWSADGRRIYFLSERDGFRCIWARPIDPATARPIGPPYAVAHFHHARRSIRTMRASLVETGLVAVRDALVFTIADMTGNIWIQTESAQK
jgi:eukaryotic-like serine/threonine-protein kinase